jgi:hypothetical protein
MIGMTETLNTTPTPYTHAVDRPDAGAWTPRLMTVCSQLPDRKSQVA